jgi:hypothetical protein
VSLSFVPNKAFCHEISVFVTGGAGLEEDRADTRSSDEVLEE